MKYVFCGLISASMVLFGAGLSAEESEPDRTMVLATVGDDNITLGQVKAFQKRLPPQYQALEPAVLLEALVNQLIQQSLLSQAAEMAPEELEDQLANEKRALLATDAIDKIYSEAATADKVQTVYEERYFSGPPEPEYHAAHILVESEDEAKELIASLEGGADFAELAKTKSIGPTGPDGGDLGWFVEERMVSGFSDGVKALEVDEISPPVKTDFGWHVIKLLGKRDLVPPALAEVQQEISEELQLAAIDKFLADAEEATAVTRAFKDLDPSFLAPPKSAEELAAEVPPAELQKEEDHSDHDH